MLLLFVIVDKGSIGSVRRRFQFGDPTEYYSTAPSVAAKKFIGATHPSKLPQISCFVNTLMFKRSKTKNVNGRGVNCPATLQTFLLADKPITLFTIP